MVDFHSHLDLHANSLKVVQECKEKGIRVLSVTTTPRAWRGTKALVGDSKQIFTALGIHPQLAGNSDYELHLFRELLPQTRFVGEIGIDGSRGFAVPIEKQRYVFHSVLTACENRGGCLLSIHSKSAAGAVLDEIESTVARSKPVLHWFSGSLTELRRAVSLGCWFSVGPPMFRSAKGIRLIREMPRDRILTETDSPFVHSGGSILMPWHIRNFQELLGNIISLDVQDVERLINDNCDVLLESVR